MKKSAIIFLFIIILAIIIAIGTLIIKENLIQSNKDYKGELTTSKQPQNLSIFVLPTIPIITIISPENTTYSTSTILLDYSVTNKVNFIWYNLDNGMNITIDSPLQFTTTKGNHTLYLYANNSYGIATKSIIFFVNLTAEPTTPSEESGGSGGGSGGGIIENITTPQPSSSITEQETPKDMTKSPEETPRTSKEIIIKFLISLLFLSLLIFLIIILITRIKRKLKKESKRKNRKSKTSNMAFTHLRYAQPH